MSNVGDKEVVSLGDALEDRLLYGRGGDALDLAMMIDSLIKTRIAEATQPASAQETSPAPESPPAGCEDWWHLKPYGYAPGGYIIRCHTCKQQAWNCDKRALNCASCATKAWRKANEQG